MVGTNVGPTNWRMGLGSISRTVSAPSADATLPGGEQILSAVRA